MDRITAIILLISSSVFSQCNENITIDRDTITYRGKELICKRVSMTPSKFTYYYELDKNMKAINDSIPNLIDNIRKERHIKDSIKVNLQYKIVLLEKIKEKQIEGITDCNEVLSATEIENIKLKNKIYRRSRSTKILVILSFLIGILIM